MFVLWQVSRIRDDASRESSRPEWHANRLTSRCPQNPQEIAGREGQSGEAVKLTSPLDGDPERAGLKLPQGLCVLANVGPELRVKKPDNHQCMTMIQGEPTESDHMYPFSSEDDLPVEFRLQPGQKYGWWENHASSDSHGVAMVHGTVNNERTRILLDSGASGSMISLDLARRLKLKMLPDTIKVSGLGGVQTYITATAMVKITLE
ncbi:Hypothetical protein PHPALM_7302 [Phytophthora palmivora]|uniref:Peptidase A2 domain-containing protein n=1 Tax=Phytophthora palmivora TaxID=4796 RepID=A0A2P4YCP9_9STRA|nr:Hypothetical protein PHPALM_7302 [Phytophthora palmivora]